MTRKPRMNTDGLWLAIAVSILLWIILIDGIRYVINHAF